MNSKFIGTGVALVTPFNPNKEVDYDGLKNLIDHLINNGVEYVVSLGTTGESATLNKEEKIKVLDFTIDTVNGRVPIVAGFGGNNTQSVINDIESYHFKNVDAILSVSPYYNKPTQKGIYEHYMSIAKAAPVPVILYNVPGRTGSNITAETTLKLAYDSDNIIAIKEASGDLVQCMNIVRDKPDDFLVISGEDPLTLPMISFGMHGVISVTANAFPYSFSEMVRSALNGDFKKAKSFHFELLEIMDILFAEGNPGGVKAALDILNICNDHLRQPLANISDVTRERLEKEIDKVKKRQKVTS